MSIARSRSHLALGLILLCMIAALLAWVPSQASAGIENYCLGSGAGALLAPDGQQNNACYGARHSLTSNRVFNNSSTTNVVGAAALYDCISGLCQYYSWVYGGGYACHPYGGDNVLYPWEKNASPFWQFIYGKQYYGVDKWC